MSPLQADNTPFVAVYMVTYNHEKFIARAIEGVTNQKTGFNYKLIIGEDCSTDNTRNICISCQNKYLGKIELIFTEKNDLKQNVKNTINACFHSGAKYIALCEGDDYWTDPLKLQKQVDFLEKNPDYVMCAHKVIAEKGTEEIYYVPINPKYDAIDTFSFQDFCKEACVHTSSMLFRNKLFNELPPMFYKCPVGDWPLMVLISEFGKTKYIHEVMSVYRHHSGGTFSNLDKFRDKSLNSNEFFEGLDAGVLKNREKIIKTLEILNAYYKGKYKTYFYNPQRKKELSCHYYDLFSYYCRTRHFFKANYYAYKCIISEENPYNSTRIGTLKRLIMAFIKPGRMKYHAALHF